MQARLKRSPNVSLVTLFKLARSRSEASFIGDYSLIAHCLWFIVSNSGKSLSRKQLLSALNKSDEVFSFPKHLKSDLIGSLEILQKSVIEGLKR